MLYISTAPSGMWLCRFACGWLPLDGCCQFFSFREVLLQTLFSCRTDKEGNHIAGFNDGTATGENQFVLPANRDDEAFNRKMRLAQRAVGDAHTWFDFHLDHYRSFNHSAHAAGGFCQGLAICAHDVAGREDSYHMRPLGMYFEIDDGRLADAMAGKLFQCSVKRVIGMNNEHPFIHCFRDLTLVALIEGYALNIGNGKYAFQTSERTNDGRATLHAALQHFLCLCHCLCG